MSSQSQIAERAPSERTAASEPLTSVVKLVTTDKPTTPKPAVTSDPAPKGMMSQPASLYGNDSMPQMLIRLTGTYSPVTPPASWRRARRTSDAA